MTIPGLVLLEADGKPIANPLARLNFAGAEVTREGDQVTVAFVPVIGATGPAGPQGVEGPTGPAAVGVPWAGNLPDGTTLVVKNGEWVAVVP